jgi:hypothetical protein
MANELTVSFVISVFLAGLFSATALVTLLAVAGAVGCLDLVTIAFAAADFEDSPGYPKETAVNHPEHISHSIVSLTLLVLFKAKLPDIEPYRDASR